VRIGLASQATGVMTIQGRRFKSFIDRSGTLYVLVRSAVVIAVGGTADGTDKAVLAARLDVSALRNLAYVTVSSAIGAPAC